MNDTKLEARLTELLDGIYVKDLASADEILEKAAQSFTLDKKARARIGSNALRKAGIAMKDSKANRKLSRIKLSAIAVLAAALIMTVSAAAVGIAANHEHTINNVFGEGASAELAKKGILINKATVNDHFAFTIDTAYATNNYARLIMTLEGVDGRGRDIIRKTGDFYVDMIPLEQEDISEFGYGERFELDKQNGSLTIDMEISYKLGEGKDIKLIICPESENKSGVPHLLEYLSSIKHFASLDLRLSRNITPISFTSGGHPDISLCDYEILDHLGRDLIRDPKLELNSGLITEEEYERLKNEPSVTFIFKDGSSRSLSCEELIHSSHLIFKGTRIDSEEVVKMIFEDSKIQYTRK